MLDPLTALNVATAVVQFVDFGSKLVGSAYEIYKSADDALEQNVEIERLTAELEILSTKLHDAKRADNDGWAMSEKDLQKMAGECKRVAQQLLDILTELRTGASRFKSWDALRKAIKSARKKSEIEALQARLESMKSQVSLQMGKVLDDHLSSVHSSIANLTKSTMSLRAELSSELRETHRQVLECVKSSRSAGLLLAKMQALSEAASSAATTEAILRSLHFKEMPLRYIQIPEAYAATNAWILEQDESTFRKWLTTSSGVFWLSGKAGSGKSTMIKFLADSRLTRKLLKQWAGVEPNVSDEQSSLKLAIVSWYFWKTGYPMQKSLKGLLHCLLYNILEQCPTLIPIVCTDRWHGDAAFHSRPPVWTHKELFGTLAALLKIEKWPSHFCFFVDGLDEYAGTAEEQHSLVQALNGLATSPYVKICVSSRPWNVFRAAYEEDKTKMIVLQDHNRADLDLYISGKLEEDPRFRKLAAKDDRASAFATEIRQRANGVFLWVFLVVRSLLDGLTEDDDIPMLQARLRALPRSLEDYFDLMLKSIDPVYKVYTARAILLACNATKPLSTQSFYYLTSEMADSDFAIKAPIAAATTQEIQERRSSVVKWVNKWCRDLLEVSRWSGTPRQVDPTQEYRVDFLHRTARDFLAAEEMQVLFERDAGYGFNTRLSLCRSYLAQAKTLAIRVNEHRVSDDFLSLAGYVMFHAKEYEAVDGKTPKRLLDELDRVGKETAGIFKSEHWTCACPRFDEANADLRDSNFLSYAIEFDLQLYVREVLEANPHMSVKESGAPLVEYAARPTLRHEVFSGVRRPLTDMIAMLTEATADTDEVQRAKSCAISIQKESRDDRLRKARQVLIQALGRCNETDDLEFRLLKMNDDLLPDNWEALLKEEAIVPSLSTSKPNYTYSRPDARGLPMPTASSRPRSRAARTGCAPDGSAQPILRLNTRQEVDADELPFDAEF